MKMRLHIPDDVFAKIARYAPIPSVDIVILKGGKVILTRRTIAPHKGFWHLPGSIVKRNESMTDTVLGCAKRELGIKVEIIRFVNYYELFTGIRHYVSHLFIAKHLSGEIELDFQGSAVKLVDPSSLPRHTVPSHKLMISDAQKYLRSAAPGRSVVTRGYSSGPVGGP